MYFGFENKDHMELFLMKNKPKLQGDKSNHVYIKDFNRFMYNKTKHKEKKYYQLFPSIQQTKKFRQIFLKLAQKTSY